MNNAALIFLGGGAGSLMRYLVAGWVQSPRSTGSIALFPIGTMTVNAIGCLLIGVLAAIFASPAHNLGQCRPALMIGVLGGFTTFSTFAFETFELANDGQWSRAGLNVLLTNAVCLGAVWIGYRVTEWIVGV